MTVLYFHLFVLFSHKFCISIQSFILMLRPFLPEELILLAHVVFCQLFMALYVYLDTLKWH